ncbi:MAG TPA: glycosyltransferase family 1 protein, partial [Patescibacteria group bacterium]|nr:glycosyltransferase family 1 protein [Patescibacteria group bacterium]
MNTSWTADNNDSFDVICLSHLRWDFVYQRPQHLMSRFGKNGRVFFFEEPVFTNVATHLDVSPRDRNITVCVPHIPHGTGESEAENLQRSLLEEFLKEKNIENYILWYYTPMALGFSEALDPLAIVFDCMDELSAFDFAPPLLKTREEELLKKADVVFTGGQSLYEAKKSRHHNIHPYPSSIDRAHFLKARAMKDEPEDQKNIPSPRLGFIGVIDERLDRDLLKELAALRPEWNFVMVGPVVKINPADLPKADNIFYLGGKSYNDLPQYLAHWDVALLPFARNKSTQYISPTKTPEYLAAGLPVVSTSIRDVIYPYGELELVEIADTAVEFAKAAERLLTVKHDANRLEKVDKFLSENSWDDTFARMKHE